MKLERSPFASGWWGTSLDNVGLQDQRPWVGTYGRYEYANLPDLPIPLDGEFGWLVHASDHQNHIGVERALENIQALSSLLDKCKTAPISLPQSFLKFVQEPRLQARIRSTTDCILDLSEAPVLSPVGDGVLVRFLADSQGSVFWYLYIPTGVVDHAVVSSPDFYDPSGETLSDVVPDPRALVFNAESFEEFLCRFWLENELWFSEFEGSPMSDEVRRYLELYRKSPPERALGGEFEKRSMERTQTLIEIGRRAHELAERHGWNAHKYAAKMAAEALAAGDMEEHDIWKMVESSLTPREISN
jgi:hypothetical protein